MHALSLLVHWNLNNTAMVVECKPPAVMFWSPLVTELVFIGHWCSLVTGFHWSLVFIVRKTAARICVHVCALLSLPTKC